MTKKRAKKDRETATVPVSELTLVSGATPVAATVSVPVAEVPSSVAEELAVVSESVDLFNRSGAEFSPCRTWRYRLWRHFPDEPFAVFIGLNPSTADETQDDPTIRRCIGFARGWRLGMEMLNLYAFRSTDPEGMWNQPDPVGPDNDRAILETCKRARLVVACWGAFPQARDRALAVHRMLADNGITLQALQLSAGGWPRHPLYLCRDRAPFPWRVPR